MSNSSCLPEDVLLHVLIRLPPKSLGRCMCVCRSWNLLIPSSDFIQFLLQSSSSSQIKLHSLLQPNCGEQFLAEFSLNGALDLENLKLEPIFNPYPDPWMITKMVGSCNGLYCQVHYDSRVQVRVPYHDDGNGYQYKYYSIRGEIEISLCNPITGSTWVLPKSPLLLKDELRRSVVFYGFGYDDVHDTYKVFLASAPPVDAADPVVPYSQSDANYEYQVYSLRSDKWRIVSSSCGHDFNDYYFHCPILNGALINHALHWILRNPYAPNHKKKNYILAFDLIDNQLDILAPLPEATEEDDKLYLNLILSVMNGCLLLTNQTIVTKPEDIVDMWVMKEYGLKDSWTRIRIHNSMYDLFRMTPVALLEEDNHHRHQHQHQHRKRKLIYPDITNPYGMLSLLSYDLESHQVVKLTPPSQDPNEDCYRLPIPLQYVPSLVKPHPPSSRDKKRMAEFGYIPSSLKKKKFRSHDSCTEDLLEEDSDNHHLNKRKLMYKSMEMID